MVISIRKFVLLGIAAVILLACEKPSSSLVVMDIDGKSWSEQTALTSGQTYRIRFTAESTDAPIERVWMTSTDNQFGEKLCVDTTFSRSLSRVTFVREWVPALYHDTSEVLLTAYMSNGGTEVTYSYPIQIIPTDAGIRVLDNITLYSNASGKRSGFSLVTYQTIYPDTIAADTLCFFDNTAKDEYDSDVLSRAWISHSGLYFSRFESFDFSQATTQSLQHAYAVSQHDNIIQDISYDNVILIGTKSEAIAACKVLLVADEEGAEDDRYVFSMKIIDRSPRK